MSNVPVTVDLENAVLDATKWSGLVRPGKCLLTPEMVILGCYSGDDDTRAFEKIQEHAAR